MYLEMKLNYEYLEKDVALDQFFIKIEFHMRVTKLALCQDHLKFAYWFWRNKIKSCEGILKYCSIIVN